MLYSKNGSVPKPHTDGTEGWIEVGNPPSIQEGIGLEVVWWYPPGWIVRKVQPADTETTTWRWSQFESTWIEYPKPDNQTIQPE